MSRRCRRCRTGLVFRKEDEYGHYYQCITCGNTLEPSELPDEKVQGKLGGERAGNSAHEPCVQVWSKLINHPGRHHPAPDRCAWTECAACEEKHDCCSKSAGGHWLCQRHQTVFRSDFGVDPPVWSEMRLPLAFGFVKVEYFVERTEGAGGRLYALAHAVTWDGHLYPPEPIRGQMRAEFLSDTGLRLELSPGSEDECIATVRAGRTD